MPASMRLLPAAPLAALVLACARPVAPAPDAPAAAVRAPGPAEFFPLAIGHVWTYRDESPGLPPDRRGATRTVRILERTADGYFRDGERGELKIEGACLVDRVRRLLCAPIAAGNRWSSVVAPGSTERYEIAAVGEAVDTPAGRCAGCVRVRAHDRAGARVDHVLEMSYAPGVGPVRLETFAVVDGKAAPQVRAVLRSYRVAGR